MPQPVLEAASRMATTVPRRAARLARRSARALERRLVGRRAVLAYHRVADPAHDPWNLSVSPQRFGEHLAVLRDVGVIETLDDVIAAPTWRRLRRRRPTFAITFDDGYVDNLIAALPLLERYDAPATVFIPTGMLDGASFWWDVLTDLVLGSADLDALVRAGAELGLVAPADGTGGDRRHVLDALHAELVRRPPTEARTLLRELADRAALPHPEPASRPMTTPELHELAAHPLISIGVHTVDHPRLTLLSPEQVRAQVSDAARRLEALLGERPTTLAYPYGATSTEVAAVARSVGIRRAVTTDDRWVRLGDDPLLMPRLHPHDVDAATFRAWISAA